MKKLISFVLCLTLLFCATASLLPVSAAADTAKAEITCVEPSLDKDSIISYAKEILEVKYSSAREMLIEELAKGYLDFATNAQKTYRIYVNRYTGMVYYEDLLTGQILTSNPVDPGTRTASGNSTVKSDMMSQVFVSYVESGNSTSKGILSSNVAAAQRAQIEVLPMDGGLRVNYVLGDTGERVLVPGRIPASRFTELFVLPMLDVLYAKANTFVSDAHIDIDMEEYTYEMSMYEKALGYSFLKTDDENGVIDIIKKLYDKVKSDSKKAPASWSDFQQAYSDVRKFLTQFGLLVKGDDAYPDGVVGEVAIFQCKSETNDARRALEKIIQAYTAGYTYEDMIKDEADCAFAAEDEHKPVFTCSLEYTFGDKGELIVSLPADSITFDTTRFVLQEIIPLKYFGGGDITNGLRGLDGYIFYPDGSGTVIEFEDFYSETGTKTNFLHKGNVYGLDYAYSELTGGAHREQITMPVYGLVAHVPYGVTDPAGKIAGTTTALNGFFAILEEGDSLASLTYSVNAASREPAVVYASYTPYPSDTYDLSKTLSSDAQGTYTIVSDSRFRGSYVTRYVMLTDPDLAKEKNVSSYYPSDYVGMATYYREYLVRNGKIAETVETVNGKLPLYIESLGSMEIIEKILSFPITVDVPLTTFDDISLMYDQLSTAKTYAEEQIRIYTEKATQARKNAEDAERSYNETPASNQVLRGKFEALRTSYLAEEKEYLQTVEKMSKVVDITNVNFKLTGFANEGMKSTYPARVHWEKAVGGKKGFEKLVANAKEISKAANANFGVYPDFDFQYISNTALFDGVSVNRKTVTKMVDNRYASKQVYNSISGEYESFFELVVSPSALDRLYTKFNKKYAKFDVDALAVSTLGSDLNSNFDSKGSVNRDEAKQKVESLLHRMTSDDGYSLMVEKGNIYSLAYADHILNLATDSSHFRYSSYTVPFTGLVLHGHILYAGAPINYSGSPAYEILRSIENGASLYYVACYEENTSHLKEDIDLSKYYGVDYQTWFDEIITEYATLNETIGDLQHYEITDHRVLSAERVIHESEWADNYKDLAGEFVTVLEQQIRGSVSRKIAELAESGAAGTLHFVADEQAVKTSLCHVLGFETDGEGNILDADEDTKELIEAFVASAIEVLARYESEYAGSNQVDYGAPENEAFVLNFVFDENYESAYSYLTDSESTAGRSYKKTRYTCDDGNVVMVTYSNGTDSVSFVLNYNTYNVDVIIGGEKITVKSYGFYEVGKGGNEA